MDNSQQANNLTNLTKPEVIRRAIKLIFTSSVNKANELHLSDEEMVRLEDDEAVIKFFYETGIKKQLASPVQQIIRDCSENLRLDLPPQIADLFHEADSILDEVERKGAPRLDEARRVLKER